MVYRSSYLWGPAVISIGVNWLGWLFSVLAKTERFYDITGTLTFVLTVIYALVAGGSHGPRQIVACIMVWLWTLRLGFFLVRRVFKLGDSRFEKALKEPLTYLIYWTMQAVWVWVTALPTYIIQGNGDGPDHVIPTDIIGPCIWLLGIGIEAIADAQKSAWRAKPENKGHFIDVGLWSLARYPNYGGEITLWVGHFIFCAGIMHKAQFATVVSPILVALLILRVSGVPLQEAQAKERWGNVPDYIEYRRRTWLLLPFPVRPCSIGLRGPAGAVPLSEGERA